MKTKYQRLSKEEKLQAIEDFKNAREQNVVVVKKLKRLRIVSILGIIYSIVSFIYDIFNSKTIYSVFDGILLVTCSFLLIQSKKVLEDSVNKFIIDRQKQKLKKEYAEELKREKKKNKNSKK